MVSFRLAYDIRHKLAAQFNNLKLLSYSIKQTHSKISVTLKLPVANAAQHLCMFLQKQK